jgi:tetratricopeptide (TPR) repeat protein
LVLPGCSRRKSVTTIPGSARKQGSPADRSGSIRSTLKISQENTEAVDEALKQLHDRRPELAALAKHINLEPGDINSRRLLASAYFAERLFHQAFQLYQEIRSVLPDDAGVELAIARIWYEWREYHLARQHAERALVLDAQSVSGLELLGRIHLRRDDLDAAASAFLSALSFDPDNATVLANLGYTFLMRGDLKPSYIYLKRAVERDASISEAQNNLGVVAAHLDDHEGALRAFMAVNEPAVAYNNLGAVYLAQRRWADARDAFNQALALDPGYSKARANLLEAQSRIPLPTVIDIPSFGEANIAQEDLNRTRPRRVPESNMKGVELIGSVAVIPSNATPQTERTVTIAYNIALSMVRAKRYGPAIERFQLLLQQYPNDRLAGNCQYWIGESLFHMGKFGEAREAFERVLSYKDSPKKRDAMLMIRRSSSNIRRQG